MEVHYQEQYFILSFVGDNTILQCYLRGLFDSSFDGNLKCRPLHNVKTSES